MTTRDPWQTRAACAPHPTDWWYDPAHHDRARAICATCPVAGQCLALATANRETHGMWAGLTDAALQRVTGGRRWLKTSPVACGTYFGYRRHIRRDEPPCDECRAACERYWDNRIDQTRTA